MSESAYQGDPFTKKQAELKEVAGYEFDVDEFLARRKVVAAGNDMEFSEHVRKYFEEYGPRIELISKGALGPLVAESAKLAVLHQGLHEVLEVQSVQREAGFDADNDPQSQRDLALVFGYWYDYLASFGVSTDEAG